MFRLFKRLGGFSSLRRKIALAVTGGVVLAAASFVFLAQQSGRLLLHDLAMLRGTSSAEMIESFLTYSMLNDERGHLRHEIEHVVELPYVENAFILNAQGQPKLIAKPDSSLPAFILENFGRFPGTPGDRHLRTIEGERKFEYILTPIEKQAACQRCHQQDEVVRGYVGLKLNMDDIRVLAAEHRNTNLLVIVLSFLGLGVLLYFILSIFVIKPISGLHAHISEIGEKIEDYESGERIDFPLVIEPTRNDEISALARDFNRMICRLNSANMRLHDLHLLRLEQADRMVTTGEMAASMAHEIRNPIAGILGALQVVNKEIADTDKRKPIVKEMMVQLGRVNQAINDLLSYARPTKPELGDVIIQDVISKTLTILAQQPHGIILTIHQDMPTEPISIKADVKQIQQVVWNIVLNGIQSLRHTGTLTVSARSTNGDARIVFSDNGKGIPPEELEKVFKPFHTTKHKGTGLGMTISRRIIEQHGGQIHLESEVGKGTTVTITIPRNNQESAT